MLVGTTNMVSVFVPVATMEVGPALEELGIFVGVSAAVTETELAA